jgi:hypothetical protein
LSFGDVDTLTLTFDKLKYISGGYDQYNEAFTQLIDHYKDEKIADQEYFAALIDSVQKYSALEFLAIKSIFEIKKTIDRNDQSDVTGVSSVETSSQRSPSLSSFFVSKNLTMMGISDAKSEGVSCPTCGLPTKKSAKFCTNCGNTA